MHEQNENINRETIKRNQTEILALEEINGSLDQEEGRISKLEDRSSEMTKSEGKKVQKVNKT